MRRPQGGKVLDPAWRHARAVQAGAAARRAYERQRRERGDAFATKGDAYAAGYRCGYYRAMRWWRRKFARAFRAKAAA